MPDYRAYSFVGALNPIGISSSSSVFFIALKRSELINNELPPDSSSSGAASAGPPLAGAGSGYSAGSSFSEVMPLFQKSEEKSEVKGGSPCDEVSGEGSTGASYMSPGTGEGSTGAS